MKSVKPRKAFTLIELLVVAVMIATLTAALGTFFWRSEAGVTLRSGRNLVVEMMLTARRQALLNHTSARLLINHDESDVAKQLHALAVVCLVDENSEPKQWRMVSDLTYLPSGVYFYPEKSGAEGKGGLPEMSLALTEEAAMAEGQGCHWFYFEFDRYGHAGGSGAYVVLGTPVVEEEAGATPVFAETTATAGFYAHKLGGLTLF